MNKKELKLTICAQKETDLARCLRENGYEFFNETSVEKAILTAEEGSGVAILADTYPVPSIVVPGELLEKARKKNLRLYVEFPKEIGNDSFGEPQPAEYERVVCNSGFFGENLPQDTILMINGCYYLDAGKREALLSLAKVAGYDRIVFGMPEKHVPILFFYDENVMVSTTALSNFITARHAPVREIGGMWKSLLLWLTGYVLHLTWEPTVGVAYSKEEKLPENYLEHAIERNTAWFQDYALYAHTPLIGVFEGFESGINYKGRQAIRNCVRADCISETAMVMALSSRRSNNIEERRTAKRLADYVFSDSFFNNDPKKDIYGLIDWFTGNKTYYGDDNARILLAGMVTANELGDMSWNDRILKCALANLRTSAQTGFREGSIFEKDFSNGKTWRDFYNDKEYTSYAPHYQCYIWVVYLWMYALTDYREFFDKAKNAIRMCMQTYPDGWQWTNSLTAEISRMLLPLSLLVRLENNGENREWLRRIVDDILAQMQDCGAVQDMFGALEMGTYPPPQSNESYGTSEASLIQENGNPATDLLYSTNWTFIGLYEASITLKDQRLRETVQKMAEFFCRIQVRSKKHPYLDGAWMRSFDFRKWEYWGSSADIGWGAWSVESGWTNSWIVSTMMLMERDKSMFDLSMRNDFIKIAPAAVKEMLA